MQLSQIDKWFGSKSILSQVTLDIKNNDRIAIVGKNGSGKSTLLKIMAGIYDYDNGHIYKARDITIGYLPQHFMLESERTIWQEMYDVFAHITEIQDKLQHVEKELEKAQTLSNFDYEKLLHNYDHLLQLFTEQGGYHIETKIETVLTGLNFPKSMYHTPINQLSGGQKTRLALGKLLLQSPNVLILDEPTNHLDITALSWLENFLNNYEGAIVTVSHDRYFLDQIVSTIYELSHQRVKKYTGSYRQYIHQRQKDYEQALKAYEKQQAEIKRMEDFIQKNIAHAATSKRARSRRKQLEKMEVLEKPKADGASASFSFTVNKQSGVDVLKISDLSFRFSNSEKNLMSHVNLHIRRGERIALVGPNGIGKTTFLKLIIGQLQPTAGTIEFGANVQVGYYDQEQASLNSSKTVLDELWDDFPHVNERDIRNVLGNFLFTGDDVLYPVHSLSGGEKARLALAKLMMKRANLLILDEPTNHLDIDSKEMLEGALKDFPGTIIFVSHDRYFINQIANYVVDMQREGITVYFGNYDYYINKKQEEIERAQLNANNDTPIQNEKITTQKERYKKMRKIQREKRRKERKISQLEEQITELERYLVTLEEEMAQPDIYEDYAKANEYLNEVNTVKQKIEDLMEQWESLHE